MATTVGMSSDIVTLVKDLVSLEHDATAAYMAAIERLEEDVSKQKLSEFIMDHKEHLKLLTAFAAREKIDVPSGPDIKVVLTKGKVVIAGLIGDKEILIAMKTNEDDTVSAYTRATEFGTLPPEFRVIVADGLEDERRHRSWIESRIDQLNQKKDAA